MNSSDNTSSQTGYSNKPSNPTTPTNYSQFPYKWCGPMFRGLSMGVSFPMIEVNPSWNPYNLWADGNTEIQASLNQLTATRVEGCVYSYQSELLGGFSSIIAVDAIQIFTQ